MKKAYLFLAPLILVLGFFIYKTKSPIDNYEHPHYHAGFIVYINGKKQDFSNFQYMNLEKCGDHDQATSKENEQLEKAHLHDGVGDVVHVHRDGAHWSDLFKNIGYDFPKDLKITGYVGGQSIPDFLKKPISANESVVIVVGNSDDVNLNDYVTLDHIKAVENSSETCGTS